MYAIHWRFGDQFLIGISFTEQSVVSRVKRKNITFDNLCVFTLNVKPLTGSAVVTETIQPITIQKTFRV